jgi:hypothetical protein
MKHHDRILTRSAARAALSMAALAGTIGFAERAQAGTWSCQIVNGSADQSFPVSAYYDGNASKSIAFYTFNSGSSDFSQLTYGNPGSWTDFEFDGPSPKNAMKNTFTPGNVLYNTSVWAAYPDASGSMRLTQIALSNPGGTPTYHGSSGDTGASTGLAPSLWPYTYSAGHEAIHVFFQKLVSGNYNVYDAVFDTVTNSWVSPSVHIDGGSFADSKGPAATSYTDTHGNQTLRVFYLKNDQIWEKVAGNGSSWGPAHAVSPSSVIANGMPAVTTGPADGLLHVFYADSDGALHESTSDTSGNFGSTFNVIDSTSILDPSLPPAPVLVNDGTTLEVYYIDSFTGTLKEAAYSSGWSVSTIDGSTSSRCGVNHVMTRQPAAVAVVGAPQVFYYDSTWGSLRVATWSP